MSSAYTIDKDNYRLVEDNSLNAKSIKHVDIVYKKYVCMWTNTLYNWVGEIYKSYVCFTLFSHYKHNEVTDISVTYI